MTDINSNGALSRRDMLGATAAVMVPLLTPRLFAELTPFSFAARFLTPAEFALVDELSEMIIPRDDVSPGARGARVAGEIDRRLSESLEPEWRATWRAGLKGVDDLARERVGKRFVLAAPADRLAILTHIASGESNPGTPMEQFFLELKGATVRAYYTSKIGIHTDQHYHGNVGQPGKYSGHSLT